MDADMCSRLLNIQEMALADKRFQELQKEYEVCHEAFLELLFALPEEQQNVIIDYFGIRGEMERRVMSLTLTASLDANQ